MCPLTAIPNADEVTRCPGVGTTDTDLGTTDARFGADALGVKLDGSRSKAHTKAGTSFMRDSETPIRLATGRTPAIPPKVPAPSCVYEHYKYT